MVRRKVLNLPSHTPTPHFPIASFTEVVGKFSIWDLNSRGGKCRGGKRGRKQEESNGS